ncbi:Disease resistance protein L6 [Linum perenne]
MKKMDYYMKGAITVVVLLLPVLYKWFSVVFGRRISNSVSISNDNYLRRRNSDATTTSSDYEVFLSYRGPDTRHQIIDLLYRFLSVMKIRTFKDDDDLRKGEEQWLNVVKAIDQCKIYVVVVSRNYAHSTWCLKELVEILERQKQDRSRIVLPVFYMVDPHDVKFLIGPYEKVFTQHHRNFPEATVQSWKIALSDVGSMKGWHIKSQDEQAAVADQVSTTIWSYLNKNNDSARD